MHIAHSNIEKPERAFVPRNEYEQFCYDQYMKGYNRMLKKRAADIAAIQEVFPGWMPPIEFELK